MKTLKFKQQSKTPNVYGRKDTELEEAVESAVTNAYDFETTRERQQAVNVVLEAFREGMNLGFGGHPSDIGKAELGQFVADASPGAGTFNLYKRLI